MKRENRMKFLVAGLSCALAVSTAAGGMVFADQQEKNKASGSSVNDETVYVMTDAQGKEYQRIVSEQGNLHYDGYEKAQLPVTMDISYKLDGKKISAEKLAGKSGHVEMTFQYKNHERREGVYVPFLTVSGMVLDHERFSDVHAVNGKIVDDGNRSIVVGYALPGFSESLGTDGVEIPESVTVFADVKKFEMEPVYTLMSSDIFTEIDLGSAGNIGELTDSLDQLTDGVDRLLAGTKQLTDGASKLEEGSGQLTKGTKTLKDGAGDLVSGTKSLASGSAELKTGADSLAEGAKELENGSRQLSEGAAQLTAGLSKLAENSPAINAGAQQMVSTALNTAQSALASQGLNVTLTQENYQKVLAQAQAAKPEAAQQLAAMEAQITQVIQFCNGVLTYTGGVDSAAAGALQLSDNMKTLETGASKIYEGALALSSGQQKVYDGSKKLSQGAGQLKAGSELLYEKQQELTAGIGQLKAGTKKLESGVSEMTEKLEEQLSKLPASDLAKVLDRMKSMESAAQGYDSFGGKGSYDHVSFICKTEAAASESKEK